MNKYHLLFAILLTFSGCVTNKYPTVNGDNPSEQRQPWGDDDLNWPYHWRWSQEGKRLVEKNNKVEEYYRTNQINSVTNK